MLAGQQAAPVLLQQRGLEALDQLGQRDHSTAPQPTEKLFIRPLMRALQLSAVWLVRWV